MEELDVMDLRHLAATEIEANFMDLVGVNNSKTIPTRPLFVQTDLTRVVTELNTETKGLE
jgi:hypothetical protein